MDQWTERLSEYLDGGIEEAERVRLEAHLQSCAECTTTLEELRQVVGQARRLEPMLPEEDLWPLIEARLEPRQSESIVPWKSRPTRARRQFTFSFPQLAAASLLLVLLSGGAVWLALEKSRPRPSTSTPRAPSGPTALRSSTSGSTPAPIGSGPSSTTSGSSGSDLATREPSGPAPSPSGEASLAAFDTGRYDLAVAELELVLKENRSRLDPATVRTIEQNLRIIDQAISQARKALDADPANPYLNGHLAEQMSRKIKLLQLASQVVTAHG